MSERQTGRRASRRRKLQEMSTDELASLISESGEISSLLSAKQARIKNNISAAKAELTRRAQEKTPQEREWEISEHAVYRYLERVKSVDMSEVRREIRAKLADHHPRSTGSNEVEICNGEITFIAVRHKVITLFRAEAFETEEQYRAALAEIETLMSAEGGSVKGARLEELVSQVERWEAAHSSME